MKIYSYKRWAADEKPASKREFPKVIPKFGYDVDPESGEKIVVKQGETNFYLQTQEALPETLVYNVIDRLNRTGDMSLLGNSVEGFIDVTAMPKTYLEAQVMRVKAEQFFDQLPIEEKKKFNNSAAQFIQAVNQGFGNPKPSVDEMRKSITEKEKEAPANG